MSTWNLIKKKSNKIILQIFLLSISISYVVLLYNAFLNSFKNNTNIVRYPYSIIKGITLNNYSRIFNSETINVFMMYKNSIIITGASLLLIICFAPLAAYYIARTRSKKVDYITMFFLLGMMVPGQLSLIPLVKMYISLELIGKIGGLFIFYMGTKSGVAVFLYRKFLKTIPFEMEESALIDGAGVLRIFWQIIFPLLKPCTATAIIFFGKNIWNDFLMPLYLLPGTQNKTITLGVYYAIGPHSSDWGLLFAMVIISSIPMVIIFLMMQKKFISGLTRGAVKG